MACERKLISLLAVSVLAAACGKNDDARDAPRQDEPASLAQAAAAQAISPARAIAIDATASDSWVYFDLETGKTLTVVDPMTDVSWDMAFRRFEIKSNGGSSGKAGVLVTYVDLPLNEVAAAPTSGYVADHAPGADPRVDSGHAFHAGSNWFDYSHTSHTLEARRRTYVARTGDQNFFKVQFKAYYDDAGTPGHVSFDYAPLAAVDSID